MNPELIKTHSCSIEIHNAACLTLTLFTSVLCFYCSLNVVQAGNLVIILAKRKQNCFFTTEDISYIFVIPFCMHF